jgi:hypothetical protein
LDGMFIQQSFLFPEAAGRSRRMKHADESISRDIILHL